MVGIGYKGVLFHQYHVPQINKMNCIDVNKNLLCQTVNNFLFMNVSFLLEKRQPYRQIKSSSFYSKQSNNNEKKHIYKSSPSPLKCLCLKMVLQMFISCFPPCYFGSRSKFVNSINLCFRCAVIMRETIETHHLDN